MVERAVQRAPGPGSVTAMMPRELIDEVEMAYGLVGTPDEVRTELDRIQSVLHRLYTMEPDLAMRHLNAFSTRLTELFRLLFRLEIRDRTYTKIRTMDVVPLLEEVDRQFKNHSRLLEARRQDMALEGIYR